MVQSSKTSCSSFSATTSSDVISPASRCSALPAISILSTALRLLASGLTNAQIDSALGFINDQTGEVPRRGDQRLFLPKIDWQINSNNQFTATYNRLRWKSPAGVQTGATVTRDRAGFGDDFVEIDSLNLRLASTLSSQLINEFRFQWADELNSQFAQPPLPGQPTTANGFSPQMALTNGITFGKATSLDRVALPDERRFQFADSLTYTSGNHTFKFGTDINRVRDIDDNLFTGSGSYTYSNINDFIVDYTNFTTSGACEPRELPLLRQPGSYRQMRHALRRQASTNAICRKVLHQQLQLRVSVNLVSS